MDDQERRDPLINDIQRLETDRLLGCAVRWALLFVGAFIILALVVRAAPNNAVRAAAAFAFAGLVLGFSTSILSPGARKVLIVTFVAVPVVLSLAMFAMRTIYGHTDGLPLRLVISPLFFTAGFLVGQIRKGF